MKVSVNSKKKNGSTLKNKQVQNGIKTNQTIGIQMESLGNVDQELKFNTQLTSSKLMEQDYMSFLEDESDPLKVQCKAIVEEIEKKLQPIKAPSEKTKILQSHFVTLLYKHKKLEREVLLLQELCTQYKLEKETSEALKLNTNPVVVTYPVENFEKKIESENCVQNETRILQEKLKNLSEQYTLREKHFAVQMKTKTLETELIKVKCKQQLELFQQRTLRVSHSYKEQVNSALKIEKDLKNQLKLYSEKFEQFQETLSKSNEVFATFKQEMERMTKTITRLEKDKANLQKKTEQTDIALIEIAEERNNQRRELEICKSKNTRLEALCRVLQSERRREMQKDQSKPAVSLSQYSGPDNANNSNGIYNPPPNVIESTQPLPSPAPHTPVESQPAVGVPKST